MGNLTEIIDSLETKIERLLQHQEQLEEKNSRLSKELSVVHGQTDKLEDQIEELDQQNQTLKAANAMLGSEEYKRETKLRINGLIREIDQCIVQLSE